MTVQSDLQAQESYRWHDLQINLVEGPREPFLGGPDLKLGDRMLPRVGRIVSAVDKLCQHIGLQSISKLPLRIFLPNGSPTINLPTCCPRVLCEASADEENGFQRVKKHCREMPAQEEPNLLN